MSCVCLWTNVENIEFPKFHLSCSSVFIALVQHIRNSKVKFQNTLSPTLSYIEHSGIENFTLLSGQTVLLWVDSLYLAVIPSVYLPEENVFEYSKMLVFYPQQYEIDLQIYNTVESLANHCIRLSESDNQSKLSKLYSALGNKPVFQSLFTRFNSSSSKAYWLYVPESKNGLLEILKSKQVPEEYLLSLLYYEITSKSIFEKTSNKLLANTCGIPNLSSDLGCCMS